MPYSTLVTDGGEVSLTLECELEEIIGVADLVGESYKRVLELAEGLL